MSYRSKVLIAIPVLLGGGTERQTLTLASVLLSRGYKVTICCYYESDTSMVSDMEKAGTEVLLLGLNRSDGLFSLMRELKTLWTSIQPDIVHVQYVAPGLIPVIDARITGIKTVFATVHQPGRVYGWKERTLLRIAAKLCNAFFCNSKSVEESWFGDSEIYNPKKSYRERKHFTIYNAVDVDHIGQIIRHSNSKKMRKDLGLNDKSVIGVVGRLRWEKGQDIIIAAMSEIIREIPNAILLIVGDGPDRASLELRAKSLKLENNILWLGQKSQQEVFELYSIMDVVAVPSVFEGFGLTAAEAMAAGRPVVGSHIDGLTEIIEEGVTGYTVSVNNSRKMAEAIIEVFDHPRKAETMGSQGRDRVKNMFSLERFAESTIAAYRHFTDV